MSKAGGYRWGVSTQAHYPAFERMLRLLSERVGPGVLLAGIQSEVRGGALEVILGPDYCKGDFMQRGISWLKFAAFAGSALARRDVPFLLVLTNPPVMQHVAWGLSRLKGTAYGLLVWDVYPKALVDVGLLGPEHPVVRVWSWANRSVYLSALFVVTLSEEMKEALVADGCPTEKISVLANWTDVEAIRPVSMEQSRFRLRQNIAGRFLVMYSGNIGAGHALEGLLDAANILRRNSRFVFYFIGSGLGLSALKQDVQRRELEAVRFLPSLGDGEFADALASADVAVVSQRPGAEAMSMPSKTYTALAAGDAILALTDSESSLGQLVAKDEVGIVCSAMDGEGIANMLLHLADSPAEVAAMGRRARQVAEERYSVEVALPLFERLFRNALAKCGAEK